MVNPTPSFNAHLDTVDLEFLKRKAEDCKGRQKSALCGEDQVDPNVKIVAALEQSLREGN